MACFMATDLRQRLQPPLLVDYLGNAAQLIRMTAPSTTFLSAQSSIERIISEVAVLVRKTTQRVDDAHIRDLIAMIQKQPDIGRLTTSWDINSSSRVISWANKNFFDLDWGTDIGVCGAFRVPTSTMLAEGDAHILPRRGDGWDCEVLISLDQGHVELFRRHALIEKFAVPLNSQRT